MVCGAHLSKHFGYTIRDIEADGFPVSDRLETYAGAGSPNDLTNAMARGIELFGQAFQRSAPDILLVLGDRYEMFAATAAAVPFAIPIAHISGGETTEGAIDEAFRHAITKMSHIHFVATEAYGTRVRQLGEDPARIFVTGAPNLDRVTELELLGADELGSVLGIELRERPLLVTYHPATLETADTGTQVSEVLHALSEFPRTTVITYPNADMGSSVIIEAIEDFAHGKPNVHVVKNLGSRNYMSIMSCAAAMVGNSSSGIIEAASFALPVVNIGIRQRGRVRGRNVIDVAVDRKNIANGIRLALSPSFRDGLAGMANPYGDGRAAGRIVAALRRTSVGTSLLQKSFSDIPNLKIEGFAPC